VGGVGFLGGGVLAGMEKTTPEGPPEQYTQKVQKDRKELSQGDNLSRERGKNKATISNERLRKEIPKPHSDG